MTQRGGVSYFLEREESIWAALDEPFPEMELASEPWSDDLCSVLRLMSHEDDVPPEKLMENAVVAVMFLRALMKVLLAFYFSV